MVDNPQVTLTPNEDGTYDATYQDAGREYEINYDSNFVKTGETVTKLYDEVKALNETAASFQTAWGLIKDGLLPGVLAADSEGSTEADLLFATVDAYQTVVLGKNNAVLMRINSWEGSHQWDSWDGTTYVNEDTNYNFHAEDWTHLGHAGTNERTIYVDGGAGDIQDETGTHFGFSASDATSIASSLSDYSSSLAAHLSITDIANVVRVQRNDSEWTLLDHSQREAGFVERTDSNNRLELFGTDGTNETFLGSIEVREDFVEIRDSSWSTVARLLKPGSGKTIDELVAEYPEFQDFAAAWTAVKDNMPADIRPENDTDLVFNVDDWGNIVVFDSASGALVGRVHSWEHTNTWTQYEQGEEYTVSNSSKGYNFNDENWNDIGRYETSERQYTQKDGVDLAAPIADETATFVSYSITSDEADWASQEAQLFMPKIPTDALAQIQTGLAANVDGFTSIGWSDISKVSLGQTTVNGVQNFLRAEDETRENARIEYFVEKGSGNNTYDEFVGSVIIRDGLIEVRDNQWNEVFRGQDTSTLKTAEQIDKSHDGFLAAWTDVKGYLSADLQADGVKFSADDWNIYAFSAAGSIIGNINFWNGEHEWTSWDGKQYKNIDTNFNFHDQNWEPLANSGVFERYLVLSDGTELKDEEGSHSGFMVTDATALGTILSGLNDQVDDLLSIDFANVQMVRQDESSWKGLDHAEREDGFTEWTDSNTSTELFTSTDYSGYVGRVETRDGFIEIYDDSWNLMGRLLDGSGLNIDDIDALYPGFKAAWSAVKDYFPSEFTPNVDVDALTLAFSVDDWDNVIVYTGAGEMIGRVNVWEYVSDQPWTNYHDGQTFSIQHSNLNFNFNDDEWNNIGRYEQSTNTVVAIDGVELAQPEPDEVRTTVSYSILKDPSAAGDFYTAGDPITGTLASYLFPSSLTAEQLAKMPLYADIVQISVGETETQWAKNSYRETAETSTDSRIEYFTWQGPSDQTSGWPEFAGVVESRGGFLEVRDSNWETVARVADARFLDDLATFAADYDQFAEAWAAAKQYLPSEITSAADENIRFSADEWHIYAFVDGALASTINYWSGEHQWQGWDGTQFVGEDVHYSFHDSNWNNLANYGENKTFIEDAAGNRLAFEDRTHEGYTVSDATTINSILTGSGVPDIDSLFTETVSAGGSGDVSSMRIEKSTTKFLSNRDGSTTDLRADEEFMRYELFKDVVGQDWPQRFATLEVREGGFVEVYDGNWQEVARIFNGTGITLDEMDALEAGFKTAWTEVESYLPSNFATNAVTFARDEREDILVLNAGNVVGRVQVWENDHGWDEFRDGSTYKLENIGKMFNFNDAEWNNIGSYEDRSLYIKEIDGVAVDASYTQPAGDPYTVDSNGIKVETSIMKSFSITSDDSGWAGYEATYGLPDNLSAESVAAFGLTAGSPSAVDGTWAQIGQISIGTETRTIVDSPIRSAETETFGRTEYFKKVDGPNIGTDANDYWYEFIGVVQNQNGFFEIRDKYWQELGRVADPSAYMNFDQVKADLGLVHFEDAWDAMKAYLPTDLKVYADADKKNDDASKFFTSDGRDVFVFDSSGEMYQIFIREDEMIEANGEKTQFFDYRVETSNWDLLAGYDGRISLDGSDNKIDTWVKTTSRIDEPAAGASAEDIAAWNALNPGSSKIVWEASDFTKLSDMPIGYLLFDNTASMPAVHAYVAGDPGMTDAHAAVPYGDVYDTTGATVNDDTSSPITEGLYLFDTDNDTAIAVVYANGTDASAGFKPATGATLISLASNTNYATVASSGGGIVGSVGTPIYQLDGSEFKDDQGQPVSAGFYAIDQEMGSAQAVTGDAATGYMPDMNGYPISLAAGISYVEQSVEVDTRYKADGSVDTDATETSTVNRYWSQKKFGDGANDYFNEQVATLRDYPDRTILEDNRSGEYIYNRIKGGSEQALQTFLDDAKYADAVAYFQTEIEEILGSVESLSISLSSSTGAGVQDGDAIEFRTTASVSDINGVPLSTVDIVIREYDFGDGVEEINWRLEFRDPDRADLFWLAGNVDVSNYTDSNSYTVSEQNNFQFTDLYDFEDLTPEEIQQLMTEHAVMSNAPGFDWNQVVYMAETLRIINPGTAEEVEGERFEFVNMSGSNHNWDYFDYKKSMGGLQIYEKPQSDDILVFQTFTPDATSMTFAELMGSAHDAIMTNVVANHGSVINALVPDFVNLDIYVLPNETFVALNDQGMNVGSGQWYVDEPSDDDEVYWELTFMNDVGDRILHLGGQNEVNGSDQIIATGENSTFAGQIYYSGSADWNTVTQPYNSMDKIPADTISGALAVQIDNWKWSNGTDPYEDDGTVARFTKPQDEWDWQNDVRVITYDIGYVVKRGWEEIDYDTFSISMSDATDSDISALKATVRELSPFMPYEHELNLVKHSDDTLYLQTKVDPYAASAETKLIAEVDIQGAGDYTIRNPLTGEFIAWLWVQDDYDDDSGGSRPDLDHAGYGVQFSKQDLTDDMTPENSTAFWTMFGPADASYTLDKIDYIRLVVREVNNDATAVNDFYLVQHFDEDGNVLGTVGVDMEAGKKLAEAGTRLQTTDTYTPIAPVDNAELEGMRDTILGIVKSEVMDNSDVPIISSIPVYDLGSSDISGITTAGLYAIDIFMQEAQKVVWDSTDKKYTPESGEQKITLSNITESDLPMFADAYIAISELTHGGSGSGSHTSAATVNVVVTVADDGSSQQNVFKLDDQIIAAGSDFDLIEGVTYVFDQSAASNDGHPLLFSEGVDGQTPYTNGVTATGTPGTAGASTTIVVAPGAPDLNIYCDNHFGMGFPTPTENSLMVYTVAVGSGINEDDNLTELTPGDYAFDFVYASDGTTLTAVKAIPVDGGSASGIWSAKANTAPIDLALSTSTSGLASEGVLPHSDGHSNSDQGIPVYNLDGSENVTAASDTQTPLIGTYAIESYDNNGTPVIEAKSVIPNSDNTGWVENPNNPNPIPLTPISDMGVLSSKQTGYLPSGSDGPMLPDGVSVMVSLASIYDPATYDSVTVDVIGTDPSDNEVSIGNLAPGDTISTHPVFSIESKTNSIDLPALLDGSSTSLNSGLYLDDILLNWKDMITDLTTQHGGTDYHLDIVFERDHAGASTGLPPEFGLVIADMTDFLAVDQDTVFVAATNPMGNEGASSGWFETSDGKVLVEFQDGASLAIDDTEVQNALDEIFINTGQIYMDIV